MEFIVWGERNEKDVQSGTGFYPGRLSYRLEQGSKVNVCADGFQVNSEPSYSKTFEVIHRGETQMNQPLILQLLRLTACCRTPALISNNAIDVNRQEKYRMRSEPDETENQVDDSKLSAFDIEPEPKKRRKKMGVEFYVMIALGSLLVGLLAS